MSFVTLVSNIFQLFLKPIKIRRKIVLNTDMILVVPFVLQHVCSNTCTSKPLKPGISCWTNF